MSEIEPIESTPALPRGGRFSWLHLLLGAPVAVLIGAAVAYVAVEAQVELGFAPLLIFPLLTGLVLGGLLFLAMRISQAGHWFTVVGLAILAAAVAALGQHILIHRHVVARAQEFELARQAFADEDRLGLPPAELAGFLRQQARLGRALAPGVRVHGGWVWLTWAVEAGILAAAAIGMVWLALRQPYCDRCRSWYRTIRSGKVDAATAQQAAAAIGQSIESPNSAVRYRMRSCRSGCSSARLELFWEKVDGAAGELDVWLDAAQRNCVMHALDGTEENTHV
ncbi:MAG: hypothetical protein ACOY3P_11650 [Planctomycetota bacterium]